MSTFKLALLALADALAGAFALAGPSTGLRAEQMQESVNVQATDNFLAESRKYLGL
jgi:hypothetical protein